MDNIEETAEQVPCSPWTVRRYLKRGIVKGYRGKRGAWYLDRGAAAKIRHHLEQHGGPGGRALIARS
jgi:hypothetical protein